ncbi:MAG TPA: hypothetical protein VLH60_00265 [Sedimentisphaerales bacterium]|nr:hypothetical protein [Sedimentisphaerales bacterium]
MAEPAENAGLEPRIRLERLLQEQYEALVNDDYQTVEDKSGEITRMAAGLSADEQKQLVVGGMEEIRRLHEQMILLLSSRKEAVAAELAATRQKRSLNKSYGVHHE